MTPSRAALEQLVWEALAVDRRCVQDGARCAMTAVAAGTQVDQLGGLTEAELLALLPQAMRDVVTAHLNGEEESPRGVRKAASPPLVSSDRPGPKKSGPLAPKKRETG
jgi:hypothetical protein